MNFFKFLELNANSNDIHIIPKNKKDKDLKEHNNPSTPDTPKLNVRNNVRSDVRKELLTKNSSNKILSNKILTKSSPSITPISMSEPTHYKKGDFIRIVQLENSPLNNYKGYNGEIRQYVKNAEHAYIVLEAINNSASIKFPIKHFVKIEH
jgi:hypothetical protein